MINWRVIMLFALLTVLLSQSVSYYMLLHCLQVHKNMLQYYMALVSCPDPFRKIEKGSGNTAIQCLVPKEFNQSRNHMLMFSYIRGQNWRCAACMIESFSKYWIFYSFVSEPLASPMNEDCCHDTPACNVRSLFGKRSWSRRKWQSYVCFIVRFIVSLCRTVRSARVYA